MSAPTVDPDAESPCPAREDQTHCEHWWDGEACCDCKVPATTEDGMRVEPTP